MVCAGADLRARTDCNAVSCVLADVCVETQSSTQRGSLAYCSAKANRGTTVCACLGICLEANRRRILIKRLGTSTNGERTSLRVVVSICDTIGLRRTNK